MVQFESELTINLDVDITEEPMVLEQCIPATRVFEEKDIKQAKHPRRSSGIRSKEAATPEVQLYFHSLFML